MASIVLDKWQEEVLAHKGDLILCTGRQIGKTKIMSLKAIQRMIEKPKTKIIIVSLTEDQAKLIINMILSELEQTHKAWIDHKPDNKPTQNRVALKNGSVAIARPVGNSGDALRGFTGDVLIIDEASRMPELAFISGEPTLLSTGGEVWMCSTPHGKKGYFWEQFNSATSEGEKENEMGWKVFHVNGEEAIHKRPLSASWTDEKRNKAIKRLQRLKERWSELRYGQEILALFLDDLRRFFDEALIEKACILKRPEDIPTNGEFFMGNDLARMGGDKFTASILHRRGEDKAIRQVESIWEKMLTTTKNEELIVGLVEKWNITRVGIDAGAGTLGVSIFDHLIENPITKRKVVAMNNRKIIIDRETEAQQRMYGEDMYDNLRAMMEKGELLLLDDPDIKNSLRSVILEIEEDAETGRNKVKIYGNDTHIAEGLKRSAWLAKKEKIHKLWITSIRL